MFRSSKVQYSWSTWDQIIILVNWEDNRKKSLRLVGQVPIDFQLASWYNLLPPAHIMQMLKNNVLLSVLWLSLISLRVCCSKCVQYQPLWHFKKIKFSIYKIGYNFIFDFTTSLIHICERNVRSFGYFEGNSMQSYHCHTIFQLVLLYSSLHQPVLYQLWNRVCHLACEYICCDYTCHGFAKLNRNWQKPSPSCAQNSLLW